MERKKERGSEGTREQEHTHTGRQTGRPTDKQTEIGAFIVFPRGNLPYFRIRIKRMNVKLHTIMKSMMP